MSTSTYIRTLQGRRIRLLEVIPDSETSILSIQLVENSLDEAEFEALSYVWGDQTEKIRIKCNGKRAEIGASLHAFLHERRRRRSMGLLWADQICIDQNNTTERTRQVRLMPAIYAKANQVIIWLGKQQPTDPEGLALAKTLYQKCRGNQYDADAGAFDFHDFDCQSRGIPDPKFDSTWSALFRILSNPWFGRVWVIQELLMAQKSVMWKGTFDLNTDVVLWSAMLIGRHRNLYENYDVAMGSPQTSALNARNIAAAYYDFKKKGPLPLYDTLSRHLGMGATDSRDRFFALAGVSSGLAEAFINYEKTFRDVACLVGKMTLLGTPNYQITEDGTEMLVLDKSPKEHRFLIEWLAFHANPQNHKMEKRARSRGPHRWEVSQDVRFVYE
ncbi:HET-domain-containing protein [Melanomma pulvis-pyrius CBS 109.77]|uniref:HET-domain-containing protein n=1 Tax=Melanomma pulvis-pyrius CBS 109.77 TaxID=1314802 RepID=A0A6A6X2W9_9PLEO|nr:HET-domain-containing protein [Melanomma pulvis-pyrius CBS 109.77]